MRKWRRKRFSSAQDPSPGLVELVELGQRLACGSVAVETELQAYLAFRAGGDDYQPYARRTAVMHYGEGSADGSINEVLQSTSSVEALIRALEDDGWLIYVDWKEHACVVLQLLDTIGPTPLAGQPGYSELLMRYSSIQDAGIGAFLDPLDSLLYDLVSGAGLVLAQVDEDSDSYPLILVEASKYEHILDLSRKAAIPLRDFGPPVLNRATATPPDQFESLPDSATGRDQRKSKAYFEEFLAGIEPQSEELRSRIRTTDNETIARRCALRLKSMARDRVFYSFSAGADEISLASSTSLFRQASSEYFERAGVTSNDSQSLQDLSVFVALFGDEAERAQTIEMYERVGVDDPIALAILMGEPLDPDIYDAEIVQRSFHRLGELLPPSSNSEELFEWIDTSWYPSNGGQHWHNTHTKDHGYRGYWCFEGAAVAKIHGYDTTGWERSPYWPVV